MRVAVVGHHEWVTFARVPSVPTSGEIVHATTWWDGPGGGGAGAAGQLAKLAGEASFFTAFGDDAQGHMAAKELETLGVTVHATFRAVPTRRAITHIDPSGERTITVMGERLAPSGDEDLPWSSLEDFDAVYFTAGDESAMRAARRAGVLVATTRTFPFLVRVGERLDAVVGSNDDPSEVFELDDLVPAPDLVVMTEGSRGGRYRVRGEESRTFEPVKPSGEIADRYGAGDSFAAGLTFGLGEGRAVPDALELAARCGAAVITGHGPFEGQLRAEDL